MTQTTTRRGLLWMGTSVAAYGAGAALVAGGCALAGEAKGAMPTDRAAWDRALAEYQAASDASDHHWRTVEEPMCDEIDRRAPHPGAFFTVPARSGQVGRLPWYPDPTAYAGQGPTIYAAAKAHHAKMEAWKQAAADLQRDAISERSDELQDACSDAETRLFHTPAPDLAAIRVKLELLWGGERDRLPDYDALVMADVRRLCGEA
jgi:hypothetical protein